MCAKGSHSMCQGAVISCAWDLYQHVLRGSGFMCMGLVIAYAYRQLCDVHEIGHGMCLSHGPVFGSHDHSMQHRCCIHAGHKSSSVDTILRKVTPHVPVSAPAVKPSQQMQQALINLNLTAAKLLSHFLSTQSDAAEEEEEGWRGQLLDYYTGIMQAGQLLPSR